MDEALLEKAVSEDTTGLLEPVCQAAYQLEPMTKVDAITLANQTNKRLGYDLFNALYYSRIIQDFNLVAMSVAAHALPNVGV